MKACDYYCMVCDNCVYQPKDKNYKHNKECIICTIDEDEPSNFKCKYEKECSE